MDHANEEQEFEKEIMGVFEDAFTRQANDAVMIQNTKPSESLNSKCEFNSAAIAIVMLDKPKKSKFKSIW